MRLLVVDDDGELRDLLIRALRRDGHVVSAAATVTAARAALSEDVPELVILDFALPDGTGVELCRELRRESSDVPVLMLSAHCEVSNRVDSLDAGADDFLGKPFAVAELRARVRALTRRRAVFATRPVLTVGSATVDVSARLARRAGVVVSLTAREWVILELLAARPGRMVTRSELLDEGWGDAICASAASLEVLIGRIRRKLGEDLIRTVRGEGYILELT